jgi:hypothetical protein
LLIKQSLNQKNKKGVNLIMATMGKMRNGIKRRNSVKRKNGVAKRRNSLTKTRVSAFARKNGLKLVSKSANPHKRRRHHKRRKNGLATVVSRRNGLLGNSRNDVKQVAYLGAGALLTKTGGRILTGFIAPYMSQFGAGKFTEIAADLAIAVLVVPFVASKVGGRGGDLAKHARLGGLLATALTAIGEFAPQALAFNPFNTSPVVMANGQAMVTPKAVAQIVAQTDASTADKAKVAGAMAALEHGQPIDSFRGAKSSQAFIPIANE